MKATPDRAASMMGHILALNKNPTIGLKNGRQPPPGVSKTVAFAKGGAVKAFAKGGAVKHADAKQDKKMIKKMVDKKCTKKAKGGKVKKMAAGGVAKERRNSPTPKPIKKVPYVNGG